MTTEKISNLKEYFNGKEPEWNTPKEISIYRALSWYSNQYGAKESKKYTLDYVIKNNYSKEIISKLESSRDYLFKNLGFVCRVITRGANLDKSWIDLKINEILSYEPKDEEETIPTKTVQDRVFEQATHYINEIEEHIDYIIKTKKIPAFNCYEWLSANQIKPVYTKQIIDHYTSLSLELDSTINKKDDQFVESYSHWTKKALKEYSGFVNHVISSCEEYSGNIKIKKPRKKKTISFDKKVMNLKYKKEDLDNKIVSINPVEIFAAKNLWVFNVKNKTLGFYVAKDETGLSVKGSTIEGFDEVLSIQKTVRKPLEILPTVIKGKKGDLKNILKNLMTKETLLSGRINSDTVLLKTIK